MCHRSVKYTLSIEEMKCEGCVKRIENILASEKGVNDYQISLKNKKITLLLKKNVDINKIISKIEALDFKIIMEE